MFLEVYPQVLGASTLKRCVKCGEYKPADTDHFHRTPATSDGLNPRCRSCRNSTTRRRKTLPVARDGYKYCPRCEREFPATVEYFYSDKWSRSGISSCCKECGAKYSAEFRTAHPGKDAETKKAWRKANPSKVRAHKSASQKRNRESANERNRRYRARNPEKVLQGVHTRRARVLGNGGTYTTADIEAIRVAQGNRCYLCGKKLKKYHVDHFIPLAKGGTNDPGNLRLACPKCNQSKNAKHPFELGRLL